MPSVTLQDVARAAGVHPSTASRALDPAKVMLVSPDTRARVQSVARDLGYRGDIVAMGLRRGRTRTIGVVVANLGNPYIAPVIHGVETALEGRGIMPVVADSRDDSARLSKILDHLLSRRVDAIVTTAVRNGDAATVEKVAREVPVVLAVRTLPSTNLASVSTDDDRGGRGAARHLVALGHTRLAQLRGPADISSFSQRGAGFASAASRAGIKVAEVRDTAIVPTVDEGARLMRLLLAGEGEMPTGVFAHNDLMAIGAIDVLRQQGLNCPRDISVIGYNDAPLVDHLDPPLTTIRIPGYELGRLAAERAVAMIDQPTFRPSPLSLEPELVERGSTAAPAG